jgi:branched-chain amino acid transport system ATP-binding protein
LEPDTRRGVLLEARDLSVSYGGIVGVRDVDMTVRAGDVIALLGPNGAGKSSALRGLCGEGSTRGRVVYDGRDISRWTPSKRAQHGIVQVPQGGGLFREMTVAENLALGGYGRSRKQRADAHETVVGLFPRLAERRKSVAGMLSGGEQTMLAIGRALMGSPRILLLDEPTIGLAPSAVSDVFRQIEKVRREGVSMVIVDQNAVQVMRLADHVYILNRGRIVYDADAATARGEVDLVDAHLGLVAIDDESGVDSDLVRPPRSGALGRIAALVGRRSD